MKDMMKPYEQVTLGLIIDDFKIIYALIKENNRRKGFGNYVLALLPYIGFTVNEGVGWIQKVKALRDVIDLKIDDKENFYVNLRQFIKFYDQSVDELDLILQTSYKESNDFFFNELKPIAKVFKMHYRYGVTFIRFGNFEFPITNTINTMALLPGYRISNAKEYGPYIKNKATVAGKLVSVFTGINSLEEQSDYSFRQDFLIEDKDYGFLKRNDLSIRYNSYFILFNIICTVNLMVYGIGGFIIEEAPIKLRGNYLIYYYLCDLNSGLNEFFNAKFNINKLYYNPKVRNAMAHYGLWQALGEEINLQDRFGGLTNKYFNKNWIDLYKEITNTLLSYKKQILEYFEKNKIKVI